MQRRLPKYRRDPDKLGTRQITSRSLAIIGVIARYHVIPTSLLVRLVQGNWQVTQRHLQALYHLGLINRFAFARIGNPGEFHYYLDNSTALDLLIYNGTDPHTLDIQILKRNRENQYSRILDPKHFDDAVGKLLFLKHEIMITRFHAMLELACSRSDGLVELTVFQQGASLWNAVEVPKFIYNKGQWRQSDELEHLPHRPDAFFTLSFPRDFGRQPMHFFYEADRHRTNSSRYNRKLRAHFHFAVKQKHRLKEIYGINRIRAVLTETVDDKWAERLRQAANHISVSGIRPSPLFWFTTSRLFTDGTAAGEPAYLVRPEIMFSRIWATPVDDTLHSLIDAS